MTTCVVCGMASEAAIIGRLPDVVVIVGAGDGAALSAKLEAAIAAGADRVISLGICGGINLGLHVGDVIVGVGATYELSSIVCDLPWCDRLFDALQAHPQAYRVAYGRFAWSAAAIARMVDKTALRTATGADVVDEETFIAGSIAIAHGIPWAALRFVCDPAAFEIPPAALVKLKANGAYDMGAILRSLARDPWEIPELVELAGMSVTALGNLRAALARIGPGFAAI